MPKPKNIFPSLRTRLEGLVQMKSETETLYSRDQKFFDWYIANKGNKRFRLAKEIITAMLNGEFGTRIQDAVTNGNTEEAIEAARDLISEFVIE